MIRSLGVRVRQYKLYLAWAVERAGRLKFNGRVLQRSPLSSLVELETLRLGVEGKAAGFRTLRVVAERDSRLDTDRLELLIARAERQSQTLEQLRIQTASRLFGAG